MADEKFSARLGLDTSQPKHVILEDAPEWLRTAYITDALRPHTEIDRDSRYGSGKPLGYKELIERFWSLLRRPRPGNYEDSWACQDILEGMVENIEWQHFYDFVEMIYPLLRKENDPLTGFHDPLKEHTREGYLKKVNEIFERENVGWRLKSTGKLERELSAPVGAGVTSVKRSLTGKFALAIEHLDKATRFLSVRPIDEKNAVKEIITGLENVAIAFAGDGATLGGVVKTLRKQDRVPGLVLDAIEKLYAFACSEPGVRHGKPVKSDLEIADAELLLMWGGALMRYIVELDRDQADT